MDRDRLKTIPLFSSLSDKALDTVTVFATETSVSAGKHLVHDIRAGNGNARGNRHTLPHSDYFNNLARGGQFFRIRPDCLPL